MLVVAYRVFTAARWVWQRRPERAVDAPQRGLYVDEPDYDREEYVEVPDPTSGWGVPTVSLDPGVPASPQPQGCGPAHL